MKARIRQPRIRDLVLFGAAAGILAVAVLFAARAAGLGGGAVAEGERLVLTLTPQAEYCVTKRAEEAWGYGSGGGRQSSGWVVAAEMAVQWNVSGGEPPYTLEIDGQSTDSAGDTFSGTSGRATVPCADTSVSWRWGRYTDEAIRYYDSDPVVDSGWKTIEAEVRDAVGRKATAEVDVYVVVDLGFGGSGDILTRGKTYRIDGHLITAPIEFDISIGGMAEPECPESLPAGERCERTYYFRLVGVDAGVGLFESDYAEASRWRRGVAGADASRGNAIDEALDEFSDSAGAPPRRDRGTR